jgi:F-type H+-transporting ATPase subunit epsilon
MAMKLEVITAERIMFEGNVDVVIAPGTEGELGILPGHTAMITVLQSGELRFRMGREDSHFAISGGFIEVQRDHAIVLADAAEHVDEIDEVRAEEAIARAQERISLAKSDIDMERALRALRRAQVRVSISRRRRRPNQANIQN